MRLACYNIIFFAIEGVEVGSHVGNALVFKHEIIQQRFKGIETKKAAQLSMFIDTYCADKLCVGAISNRWL